MLLETKVVDFQKTGDYSLGKDILEESYPIAEKLINAKYRNFGFREDLQSEAHDAIVSAIYAFDSEKKVKFQTFVGTCIRNRILNYIKRKQVQYRYKEGVQEKELAHTEIETLDCINAVKELSPNHFDSLIHGQGSRSMKFRAKQKLLENIN